MGVHGLWKLIEPAGKPVPLETLENKVLAVDVSIWLYQLTKGLQTTGGGAVPNAHILGLFNRICKLLYYRIKPVFVFDGGVPLLKKETIEARRIQKLKAKDNSEQLREKLLNNLLKQKAVNQLLGSDNIPGTSRQADDSDLFALPPLPAEDDIVDSESDGESDTEMSTARIESFCDYQLGKDVHSIDITSQQFKSLPPEIRHEILSELQETRKQSSWGRIHEMPEESTDFSKYQMSRLMKRRNVQRSLDEAAKEIGGRPMTLGELEEMFMEEGIMTDSLRGRRIAGDDVTRYVYIKGNKSEKNPSKEATDVTEEENPLSAPVSPKKPREVNESEFRNSLYEIDQCMFIKDSSSDDDDVSVVPEHDGSDYASQLSREEKISQEEILRLIKEQNARKKTSPQPSSSSFISGEPHSSETQLHDHLPSSSGVRKEKPLSNLTDIEDDPKTIEASKSNSDKENFQQVLSAKKEPESQQRSLPKVEDPQKTNLAKRVSILQTSSDVTKKEPFSNMSDVEDDTKMIEPPESDSDVGDSQNMLRISEMPEVPQYGPRKVDGNRKADIAKHDSISEATLTPPDSNRSSPDVVQDSDILDSESIPPNGGQESIKTQIEELTKENDTISYAKSMSKLDKMISSVTGNSGSLGAVDSTKVTTVAEVGTKSVELFSSSESDEDMIEVTDAVGEESPYFEDVKTQNLEITIDPSRIGQDDIFSDVFTTANETLVHEAKEGGNPTKVQENLAPKVEEKKSNIVLKDDGRYKKLAEVFQKAKKAASESKVVPKKPETVFTPAVPNEVVNEELLSVQRDLHAEEMELLNERGRQERLGSTISQQMIIEAQELLQLFGLPYVVAPMEAEAQCAFLDQAHLTEGTITDDSDIWLFGGQKVYKNFFDNRKYVLQFRDVDIEHFFKLSREQLIQMAMLVGSDYAVGIEGIGPVTAIEILAYFSDKSNKPETEADIAETLRKFKLWIERNRGGASALSRKVKNVSVSEGFPSMAVIEAYMYPTVDESKEGFTWATPDLDRIRQFMKSKFGWKMQRIDEILLPVIKRLNDRNKQSTLDAFFKAKPHASIDTGNISKRVIQAINIMKNKVDVDVTHLPTKSPRKPTTRKTKSPSAKMSATPSPKKKRTTAATKNLLKTLSPHKPSTSTQEVIPQREKNRLEAAKRKLDAVKILQKSRSGKRAMTKRKTPKPRKDSSYLSESSSNED